MPPLFLPPQFSRDVRGTVAVVTALAAIVLLVCAGVALDYLRLVRTRTDLQAALDTATLAAAARPGVLDQTASRYFSFNGMAQEARVTAVNFSKRSDGTVDGVLTAEIQASFLSVAGFGRLTLRVASAARGIAPASPTKLSLKITGGNSNYDKEFFVVVKDKAGLVLRETKLFDYNYECLCHTSGPIFTPAKGSTVSVTLAAGETASYKLVVYRDPFQKGFKFNPDALLSDAAHTQAYLKLAGQCADLGGQTQNWEDGLATTYESLIVNVTCESIPGGRAVVTLVR